MSDWTDAIVGERMTVDREFNERIRTSEFTNQEWGLIMAATEFEIENADDAENAHIVANTDSLPQIMPELKNIRDGVQQMGGGGGGGSSSSSGGVFGSIKDALLGGGGGGGEAERLEAAERLTQEYADELQAHLESKGKFEQVRIAYQE